VIVKDGDKPIKGFIRHNSSTTQGADQARP
jgi:hypothetical protein